MKFLTASVTVVCCSGHRRLTHSLSSTPTMHLSSEASSLPCPPHPYNPPRLMLTPQLPEELKPPLHYIPQSMVAPTGPRQHSLHPKSLTGWLLLGWKHQDQKHLGVEKMYSAPYTSVSLFVIGGNQDRNSSRLKPWRQELTQRAWRNTPYWLEPHGSLSLPFDRRQSHPHGLGSHRSITNYENVLQACLQSDLMEAFLKWSFPFLQ